jgi:hypothetical protein
MLLLLFPNLFVRHLKYPKKLGILQKLFLNFSWLKKIWYLKKNKFYNLNVFLHKSFFFKYLKEIRLHLKL